MKNNEEAMKGLGYEERRKIREDYKKHTNHGASITYNGVIQCLRCQTGKLKAQQYNLNFMP